MAGEPGFGGPTEHDEQMPLAYLAGASAVGFWDWDMVTNVLSLSSGWKRQIGYAPNEIPDRFGEWEKRLHPDDVTPVMVRLQAYLDQPDGVYENEFRFQHRDGSYRWILARGGLVKNQEGQPIRMVGCHIDMTERKVAEREAAESRQQYADLVRSIDGIIWEADAASFRFHYVSDRARDLLGYPTERWLDEPTFWQDHLHPDDRDRVVSYCVESTARGESHQFEYRMIAADGRIVWLRDLVTVVNEPGKPTLIRGLMIDVTDRKAVEDELHQDRLALELSMDLGRLGRWEVDFDEDPPMVTLDDQTYRILRTTAAEQGGYQMSVAVYAERFLPPDVRDRIATAMEGTAGTTDSRYTRQVEQAWVRADGTVGFVMIRYTLAMDADGRVVSGRGVVQDITDRKQTELRLTRLLQGESLLSALSQSFIEMSMEQFDARMSEALRGVAEFGGLARAALFLYAKDGRRVLNTHVWSVDPADSLPAELQEIPVGRYGFFRQELTASRVVCVERESDLPADSVEAQWARECGFRAVLMYPVISHSRVIGFLSFQGPLGVHRLFDADLKQLLGSFASAVANLVARRTSDQERRILERQLLQAQKMEAIGTLAGGIAHDFNNILGAIVGNLGLARIESEQGRPIDDSLLEIERASERAGALIQQILAFSRQQEHERQIVALAPIVEDATRLMRATIPALVAIETSIGTEVPDIVADQTQIHQIVMNLCANAWHAMDERTGTISVELTGSSLPPDEAARMGIEPGRYACLSVRDNGRGMDEDTLTRIFDPFFTTKMVGKGTGLGMSVVHGIVRSHLGGISIVSKVGGGTVVRVFVPAASGTATAAAPPPPTIDGYGEHILLVDDEEPIVRVMTRILERLGYQVTAFAGAVDALADFRRRPHAFDLVISDYEMPDATGLELASVIYSLRPRVPVILCSGRYRADTRVAPDAAANIRRLITKPCSAGALSRVVREVLDEHPQS